MCMDLLDPNFDPTPEDADGTSPDWFNTKAFYHGILESGKWMFQLEHVGVWDEPHCRCVIGDGAAMAVPERQLKFKHG